MSQLDFFLGTLAPFLRASEPDGDGLLSTFDFAAFATLAGAKRATLFSTHSTLYRFACSFAVFTASGFPPRAFLGCHLGSSRHLED